MELSTGVLLEALSSLAVWRHTGGGDTACYAFPLLFSETGPAAGHVLLLAPEEAGALPSADRGALAVFSGPPRSAPGKAACPALIPDRALAPEQILRCLIAVYDRLERWAAAIADCSSDMNGIRQMLQISAVEMKGDLALIDVSYHVPAFTNTGASNIALSVDLERGRATEDAVSTLSEDPRITAVRSVRGVQLYESYTKSDRAPKTLYRNMFRKGETSFYNRLLLFNMTEQYSETDRFMVEYLAQRVERITAHLNTYAIPASEYLALQQQLLRVPQPDYRQTSSDLAVLSPLGWQADDCYRFLILKSFYSNRDAGITDYILRSLEQTLPASYGTTDGDRILLLQNFTRANTTRHEMRRRLADFLRENLYKAGISNEFYSFSQLRAAYCQAEASLTLGEKRDPTFWYYPFERYLGDYLIWKTATDIPQEMLGLPALVRLYRMDREKGTDYAETLRVLSEVNFNTTHAAQRLYVHRTTLQNRIDRIQQLTALDLNDNDVRFLLQFSFRLLEK